MAGLIEQIQRAAIDRSIPVSTLLRQVKLAAAKLQLGEAEDWVEKELTGYYNDTDVPNYRRLQGQPSVLNPYRGWIPINGSPKLVRKLAEVPIGQPIESLEDTLKSRKDGGILIFRYNPETIHALQQDMNYPFPDMGTVLSNAHIADILSAVRDLVLDWAIKLEKIGVAGEGFSFSHEEKARAQQSPLSIQNLTIGNFAGNLGLGNSSGAINQEVVDLGQVGQLLQQVRTNLDGLEDAGINRSHLEDRLSAIEAEMRRSKPDPSLLRGLLVDMRTIVTGAAGNLMASGVIHMINQALGTGVPS